MHPEIIKFWKNYDSKLILKEYTSNLGGKYYDLYEITVGWQPRWKMCIAFTRIGEDIIYNYDGKQYSEKDMLRLINMLAFV